MESSKVNDLVERFWAGDATEMEERQLREFFQQGNVPAHLEDTAAYFLAIKAEESMELPEDFEQEVMAQIRRPRGGRLIQFNFSRIAASLLLVIGLSLGLYYFLGSGNMPASNDMVQVDTFEDPQQAYEEVKRALMMVSTRMNDGMTYSQELGHFSTLVPTVFKDSGAETKNNNRTVKQ